MKVMRSVDKPGAGTTVGETPASAGTVQE